MTGSALKPLITLTILLVLPIIFTRDAPVAQANPASFTLHGRIVTPAGWGFTANSVTSPGPDLTAQPGENVVMTLRSADGIGHNFGIDLDNDGIQDPGEPVSPPFGGTFATWPFTAPTTPGTYTYICFIHGGPMVGPLIVTGFTHDVAITALTTSRNFAYNSVSSSPIQVNVTAANTGTATENFFVSATANVIVIGNQSVTVPAGGTTKVTFNWNPENLLIGNYQLRAQATTVPDETSIADNKLDGSIFTVKFKGDVNGDCVVNVSDLASVGAAFGSTIGPPASPNWNPNADLNNDGVANVSDLATVGSSFGQSC